MDRAIHRRRPPFDWRGWIGVAWAIVWGITYAAMVIRVKAG